MTKFVDTLAATTNIKITEIIPFTEKTKVKNRTFLVSMDVMSLDTHIQQNEGILKNNSLEMLHTRYVLPMGHE